MIKSNFVYVQVLCIRKLHLYTIFMCDFDLVPFRQCQCIILHTFTVDEMTILCFSFPNTLNVTHSIVQQQQKIRKKTNKKSLNLIIICFLNIKKTEMLST